MENKKINRIIRIGETSFYQKFDNENEPVVKATNINEKDELVILPEDTLAYKDDRYLERYYCRDCNKLFDFEIVKMYYSGPNSEYAEYRKLFEKYYLDGCKYIGEIECPHCHNKAKEDNIKAIKRKYTITRNIFVDDDKMKVTAKSIRFEYYRGRLVTFKSEDRIIFNLKTGMTYRLGEKVNGKLIKGDVPIKNISYCDSSEFFNVREVTPYTDACEEDTNKMIKQMYNIIRDYKMNNNIVDGYIPTFEQTYNGKERINMTELAYFNRFPMMNPEAAMNLFCSRNMVDAFYETPKNKKKFNNIRRKIAQNEKDTLKTLLTELDVVTSKVSKKKLLNNGVDYIYAYQQLKDVMNLDNIYKIVDIIDYVTAARLKKAIIKDKLTASTITNLCNKLVKRSEEKGAYYRSVGFELKDTLYIYENINKLDETYKIDWTMSIREMHDTISKDYNKIKQQNHEIDYTDLKAKYKNLLAGEYNGLKFALAKDTYELIDVGNDMHICVGGYGYKALEHNCYIVVARTENNDAMICIEIDKDMKTLVQTKLKYNRLPSGELRQAIIDWATDNKLDFEDCYDMKKNETEYELDNQNNHRNRRLLGNPPQMLVAEDEPRQILPLRDDNVELEVIEI